VTRYVGTDNTSAQVLGTEDVPVDLSGVFDDAYTGNGAGHALALRRALEGLLYSGDLIRLGYNNDQRWGFLDAYFEEETPERIKYNIKFEPLYRRPPSPATLVLAAAPTDNASKLSEAALSLDALVTARPPIVRDDFAQRILYAWAAAENSLGVMVAELSAVVYYAELTAEVARQMTRSASGALRGLAEMTRALRAAGAATLSDVTGPELLTAELWRDDLLAEARALRGLTLGVARDLAAVATPTSLRTHTVKGGETLQGLALSYYGDFGLWSLIADGNGLDDDTITPGQTLIIPTKPSST